MLAKNGFVEIASMLVNPEIFTRLYRCDVERYGLQIPVFYRSCIVSEAETKKIEAHLDGIFAILLRKTKRPYKKERLSARYLLPAMPRGMRNHEVKLRLSGGTFGGKSFRLYSFE